MALQLQPRTAAVSGDRCLGAGPGTQGSVGEVGWERVCGSLTRVQAARVTSRMLVPVSSQEWWHSSLATFVDSLVLSFLPEGPRFHHVFTQSFKPRLYVAQSLGVLVLGIPGYPGEDDWRLGRGRDPGPCQAWGPDGAVEK